MKSKHLLLLNFFAILLYSTNATILFHGPEEYVPIILRICEYYSTSAVVFVHPAGEFDDYTDLFVTHISHTWSRLLNRKGIVTLDVNFHKMFRATRYYNNIVRPLFISLIPDLNACLQFANATKSFKMNFPAWFVIFLRMWDTELNNYCHVPPGNPFTLSFDTEMLVLCNGDGVLREWYSIDGNSTDIFELAVWNPVLKDIDMLTNLSLYERRNNLRGKKLRAVIVQGSVFSKLRNGKLDAYFGKIADELTNAINFTLEFIGYAPEYGRLNATTNKWSGAIGDVVSGHADMGVSDFAMTELRLNVVDFLSPMIIARNYLYIMQPEVFSVRWFAYFEIYSCRTWLYIIITMIISQLVLTFIKRCLGYGTIRNLLIDEFFHVWSIFCQQGSIALSECSSLRVAYFSIFGAALIIFAAYSGSTVCILTACIRVLPFLSIDEFVKDGSYSLIVQRGSADYDIFANSQKPLARKIMKLLRPYDNLPTDVEEGFRLICKDPKLVFYSSEAVWQILRFRIPCKVSGINAERVDSYSIILSKNNQYTGVLNFHLRKFETAGLTKHFSNRQLKTYSEREIYFQPVELLSVASVLAILVIGILLGLIILIVERYIYNRELELNRETSFTARKTMAITFAE